uniref:Transcription elongation factor A (SII), 3 n=1 Tax=Gasterosteus aculeatus aculeatus TaxID=481459 RepID=G3NWD9_GASAC
MTREEDLTRIAKKLDKMVSRNNTEGALDLLRELKSFNMTLKLLQETRIGMSVNGIRKNSTDEEVIALAKLLIKDWKRLLGKADTPKTPTSPTSPMSPSGSSSGGPVPPHLATGDSVRDKCIYMLAAALRTDGEGHSLKYNYLDCTVAHIYQETKATDMKYKNRVRSRISNLKDPKNPGLRRNVLAGSIDLSRIASMSAQEMASDELKQLRNVLTQEAIREHQMAKTGGTSTDLLQCGKCKKRNCTYNQVQTRSADEPMTTFVLCNECGNRWKVCFSPTSFSMTFVFCLCDLKNTFVIFLKLQFC